LNHLRYGDQVTDLINEFVKVYLEKDENKKKELQERLSNEVIPNNLKLFESKLAKTNTGYLIGKGLTWTDLYLVSTLEGLGPNKEAAINNFPHLKAHEQRIISLPKIAEWINKRPKTDM
jgi:glutathione S-transferase